MKIGMMLKYAGDSRETVSRLQEFESVGLDRVVVAEAYSFDAVSQLAFVAAMTQRMEIASGILPLFSRTPTNLAMTAAGLDYVSGGRFVLGIGASGPQVIEGFHGVKYDAPLGRARETAEICRQVWRREPLNHQGKYYQVPLGADAGGSGLGKPLKLINHPVRERIPMMLAAIGPKNTALAAEVFDEWQPFLFHPDLAADAFGEALAAGTAKRDPAMGALGINAQVSLLITNDADAAATARASVAASVALYVGGMGARGKNFYNDLMVRYGYPDAAKTIQDLYLDGKKGEAIAAVPDEFVRAISFIGSSGEVAERVAAHQAAGVTVVLVTPEAPTHQENVAQVEQLRALL